MAKIPRKSFATKPELPVSPECNYDPRFESARWVDPSRGGLGASAAAWGLGPQSPSGSTVNEFTALTATAVYNAVNLISSALASMDLYVCEKLPGGGRRPAPEHRAFDVVHSAFNPIVTSYIGRQTTFGHACLRGNGYVEIERWQSRCGGTRRPQYRLHVMDPRETKPVVNKATGQLRYELGTGGAWLSPRSVLHFKMWSYDGIEGLDPVSLCCNALGLLIDRELLEAKLIGNGAILGGAIEVPGATNEVQKQQIQDRWDSQRTGVENAGKTPVMINGMKWIQNQADPEKLQMSEARKFSIGEVGRIWNIPPSMLGLLEGVSFNSLEQLTLLFLSFTLGPWIAMVQGELDLKLFSPEERTRYCVWHDPSSLIRLDSIARAAKDKADFECGKKSVNELRLGDGLNPKSHPAFDLHFIPVNNLSPLESMAAPGASPTDPDELTDTPQNVQVESDEPSALPADSLNSLRAALVDVIGRWDTKAENALVRIVKRPTAVGEVDEFYRSHTPAFMRALEPILALGRVATGKPLAFDGETHCSSLRAKLLDAIVTTPPEEMPSLVRASRSDAEMVVGRILETSK